MKGSVNPQAMIGPGAAPSKSPGPKPRRSTVAVAAKDIAAARSCNTMAGSGFNNNSVPTNTTSNSNKRCRFTPNHIDQDEIVVSSDYDQQGLLKHQVSDPQFSTSSSRFPTTSTSNISQNEMLPSTRHKSGGYSAISAREAELLLSCTLSGTPMPQDSSVIRTTPRFPKAGSVYIFTKTSPKLHVIDDGYDWKEILNKPDIRTESGIPMHYQLCYVASPQVSSKFQRELYEMEDLMLACYNGDETFAQTKYPSNDRRTSTSNPSSMVPPKSSLTATSCSMPNESSMSYSQPKLGVHNWKPPDPVGASKKKMQLKQISQKDKVMSRETPEENYHPVFLQKPMMHENQSLSSSLHIQWYQDLAKVAEELANGKVVKNLTIFPSLQLTLVHPDMTKEFENCCRVLCADLNEVTDNSNNGIKLFYDTTISFGSIYGTLLTFVNCCYEGNPVMPLAVNLHERKFKSSHQIFWARIVGDLPALQKYRFPLIIDDAEPAVHLAVKTQAPNLVQLEAWTHRFRDIDNYLKARGYGEEAIHYYKNCIDYLLHSESKQSMHDRFRKEFESVWPKDFVFYYRQKLLPRSGRLGKWAMLKMKIKDDLFLCPHTNPQVEFHIMCQNFAGWDRLGVDQLVRAFYFLFLFFISESSDGKLVDGIFKLKRQYKGDHGNRGQHQLRSSYKYIPHPSQIGEFILRNYPRSMSTTPSWMAYGATEVYAAAKVAQTGESAYSRGLSSAETQMEEVCDIEYTLENLIGHNSLRDVVDVDTLQFSDLAINPSLLGERPYANINGGQLTNSSLAPPSPAPNGRIQSPSPLTASEKQYLQASLAIPRQQQYPTSSAINDAITTATSVHHYAIPPTTTNIESTIAPTSGTSLAPSAALGNKQGSNKTSGLSTIHENPSIENRPVSRLDWTSSNEYHDFPLSLDSHAVGAPIRGGTGYGGTKKMLGELRNSSLVVHSNIHPSEEGDDILFHSEQQQQHHHNQQQQQQHQFQQQQSLPQQPSQDEMQYPISVQRGEENKKPLGMVAKSSIDSQNSDHVVSNQQEQASGNPLPSSMMLWKKVQHYVVFGGSFITSAKDREENNSRIKHE